MFKNIVCLGLVAIASILISISPVMADTIDGEAIFTANCAGCHPKGGNIIRRGKNLKSKALKRNQLDSEAAIVSLVANGKGNMSAYSDRLTETEIEAVSRYVLDRAAANWR